MALETKKPPTDIHIRLRQVTAKRLQAYVERNYPGHHALSLTVDRAVERFLDHEEQGGP